MRQQSAYVMRISDWSSVVCPSDLDRDGGGAVGVYAGNPASFATLHYSYASSFGRALGPAKIFNALHVDTGAKNLAQELLFGSPVHWTFPDLEECDFLILDRKSTRLNSSH